MIEREELRERERERIKDMIMPRKKSLIKEKWERESDREIERSQRGLFT